MKVARFYSDEEMFATLSQTLTWSHFLKLVTIEDNNKRLFYQRDAHCPMVYGAVWIISKRDSKEGK
ncbi:hypothetical protein [Prevotella sp. E13-17]|uniref:hypothetical protein n=1 Tax=Prevotella sp. E13-17 TaxID=2913616 RepID=UPI00351CBD8E